MLKIACSEDDFKTEFEKVSGSISWLCLITKFIGVSKEKRKSNQLAVLNQMHSTVSSFQSTHKIFFVYTDEHWNMIYVCIFKIAN